MGRRVKDGGPGWAAVVGELAVKPVLELLSRLQPPAYASAICHYAPTATARRNLEDVCERRRGCVRDLRTRCVRAILISWQSRHTKTVNTPRT